MDLNAPLGIKPPKRSNRHFGLIAAAAIALVAVLGLGALLMTADPHGGEPYVVSAIPPPKQAAAPAAATAPDPMPTGSLAQNPGDSSPRKGTIENGVKVYRGGEVPARSATSIVIDVTKALDDPLRKSGSPKPSASATAAPSLTGPSPAGGSTARIAIFIGGMGLSQVATRTAIEIMPPGVDLAFVPLGETVAASADAAKAKGHEILLQLPMQNGGGSTPGPHSLRPDEPETALAEDMTWLMSRFGGYAGVTNLLGAPVTANSGTMTSVLRAVAARGLFFVDDGTSKRSVTTTLAPTIGIRAAQADIVLDATGDPAVVRANLERLVALAKQKGSAIGMASGLPEHLAAIASFANGLAGRGVTLVPVSALAGASPSVATSR